MRMLALCQLLPAVFAAAPRANIVQIVADDLGYHDLGTRNGGLTITPAIDALIEGGVT